MPELTPPPKISTKVAILTAKNILSIYNLATVSDIEQGQRWYARALSFAGNLAMQYDVHVHTIVGVIAALSPRNRWERNMQDAESMVKVYAGGGTFDDLMQLKVCTFKTGKAKAAKILTENMIDRQDLLATLNGPKLQEFFNCILGDSGDVCIDGHAYSIWMGERITLANVPSIGKKLRQTIKTDYQSAAQILDVEPHIVQAVTWVAWRRIHGV